MLVTGERRRFSSAILPAWSRKSPRVAEVLPLLYLHGLYAATITRLTSQWHDEARAFNARSLASPRRTTPKGQPFHQLHSTVFDHDYLPIAPPTFVAHQVLTIALRLGMHWSTTVPG
jgi:hypothetical protein